MHQKDLARLTGYCHQHVSDVKTGRKPMSLSFAKKLESVTGIPAAQWLGLEKPNGDPWKQVRQLPD